MAANTKIKQTWRKMSKAVLYGTLGTPALPVILIVEVVRMVVIPTKGEREHQD
jgi:hypothetical protein